MEDDRGIPLCGKCGCSGNEECVYPPKSEESFEHGCQLDEFLVCPCCYAGINRMKYRPEEDGQEELFDVGSKANEEVQ
jgi:hypothetical protein